MKDNREPMLVFKGKDINLVIDALEVEYECERDNHTGKDYQELWNKIKEVMRIE